MVLLGVVTTVQGEEVRLKFSPEVGRTYRYAYAVNLDKTTFGRTSNEQIEARFLMHILSRDAEGYQTRWEVVPGRNNLQPEVMDTIKDQVSQARAYTVSEQYVFTPDEGQSLFLPQEAVPVGAAWEGLARFSFADLATSRPPKLRQQYRLLGVEQTSGGRVARIEGTPVEKRVTAPLEAGQLGIRCDERGAIIQLRQGTEAAARLRLGDSIVAINGQACPTPKRRSLLAARFIEPLQPLGSNVSLTVQREGASVEVQVPSLLATLGLCQVDIVKLHKKVAFHLDKGVVLSEVTTAELSVSYQFPAEPGFIDDFQGKAVSNRVTQSSMPARRYLYEWRLELSGEPTAVSPAQGAGGGSGVPSQQSSGPGKPPFPRGVPNQSGSD